MKPGFGTSAINQPINAMTAGQEQIGYNGRGRYTQTGGTNSAVSLFLGGSPGSTGTYELGAGSLSVSSFMYIGSGGYGTLNQNGGSLNITGGSGLSLGAAIGGNGNWNLSNGSVTATTISNGYYGGYGTIQQTGGFVSVSGGFFNGTQGNYNLAGGSFSGGPLYNSGTFQITGGSFTGGGSNNTYLSMSSGSFTNSTGFTNFGTLVFSGGSFINNALMDNVGQIQINGNTTLGGNSQFINDTTITQSNGSLDVAGTGQFTNNGNINMASGWSINFSNTNAINNGTINLNGARIGGNAFLVNRSGATVTGAGLITSLSNQGGRLFLSSGTTRVLVFSPNTGVIELSNSSASLAGGAFTNNGQILGRGSIGNDINNSGTIEADDGNLSLGGVITNAAIGTLRSPQGGKIIVINGMSANGGLINLTGGTFDNNGFAINNTGQISGFGTLRSGGLTNNGSITFTGGFTNVFGNVTNAAAHQIKVAYNPALFTGTVTNNGIFKITSTTTTFSGAYFENGTYISDPSDNFFNNVSIGSSGAWIGGAGDRFIVSGDLVGRALLPGAWQTEHAQLRFTGGADHLLSILGADSGANFEGYNNNFSWGSLVLDPSAGLILSSDQGGALYVHELLLSDGLNQLSRISSNGLNIYYDLSYSANTYLNGQTYNLPGGGQISPVPEPGTSGVAALSLVLLAARRRKKCARVVRPHSWEFSSQPVSPFAQQRRPLPGMVAV
jgi:hypothetical protein